MAKDTEGQPGGKRPGSHGGGGDVRPGSHGGGAWALRVTWGAVPAAGALREPGAVLHPLRWELWYRIG